MSARISEDELHREFPGWETWATGNFNGPTTWSARPEGARGSAVIIDAENPEQLAALIRQYEENLDHHLDDVRHRLADAEHRARSGAPGGYRRDQVDILKLLVSALEKLAASKEKRDVAAAG